MLTAAKNQFKVTIISIKYALIKETLNKATFISNNIFMILNNASFLFQWIVLYAIKDSIGGYAFKEILLLWGLAASTYGISRAIFASSFDLADTINQGKLDAFLVQPKSVLLSVITTKSKSSAIGDVIFGYLTLIIYGINLQKFLLFNLFSITGAIIITSFAVILGSLSFWISKSDIIADSANEIVTCFATYPDGIFKNGAKIILFTIIPIGIANYIPIKVILDFNLTKLLIILGGTTVFIILATLIFNTGLKKYSSGNLMSARV